MKNKIFSRVAAIILMITPWVNFNSVWADDDINTSMFITPMQQELLLTPGEQYQGTLSVSNGSSAQSDLSYSISVGAYSWSHSEDSKDDYGSLNVEDRSSYNIMMDWIELEKDSGKLAPGSQEKILFTINVPETAPAGAQYASILVTNISDNDEGSDDENNVMIKSVTRLASAIIANVAGTSVEKGSVTENSFPSFLLNGEFKATSMVKNEGNVYTNAEYILQVWPLGSEEEICTNEEDVSTSLVLPDTSKYHTEACQLPSLGIFRAKQTVKIFGEESIVEKTIIVCPIWLLFIIIFAIFAIIFYFIAKAKARKKSPARSGNSPAPQQ